MTDAEATLLVALIAIPLGSIAVYIAGWFAGRDAARCRQARKNAADAEQMRAGIRELDERTAQFAPPPTSESQSVSASPMAEARSTTIALLPHVTRRRRCL